MKAKAYFIYWISEVIYRLFEYNTASRKKWLYSEALRIQNELDEQHNKRDEFNEVHNTNWTTKAVMEIIEL